MPPVLQFFRESVFPNCLTAGASMHSRRGDVLQEVKKSIEPQIYPNRQLPFVVDEAIAKMARDQFNQNFTRNRLISKCSSLIGVVSSIGLTIAVGSYFFKALPIAQSMGLAVISFVLNRIWIYTRNQEGYALHSALTIGDEDEIIKKLSSGANIYLRLSPIIGAAPDFIDGILNPGGHLVPSTPMQYFAEMGKTKVVAYLAMLEPSAEKRRKMVTDALPGSNDINTAQLLIDLGGDIHGRRDSKFFYYFDHNHHKERSLDLLRFFVQNGALLDAGIDDYMGWDAERIAKQNQLDRPWHAGDAINLHPDFLTPLEELLGFDRFDQEKHKRDASIQVAPVLEAIGLDPAVYRAKPSPEELYHSLNLAGVRIRSGCACALFGKI